MSEVVVPSVDDAGEGMEKENAEMSPVKSSTSMEMENTGSVSQSVDGEDEEMKSDREDEESIDNDNYDNDTEDNKKDDIEREVEVVTIDDNEKTPSKGKGTKRRSESVPSTPKTPKGMSKEEREAEKLRRKLEREQAIEAKRLEKERLQREKEEKRKAEEEKREQKRREEEERKEKKRKEEEERKEKKRKEEEEKAEEKRKKEEERKKKEEEKLKKKQLEEEKKEQKRKEEEEKKEAKIKEEQAMEEKKKRASNRFISFFKKDDKKPEEKPVEIVDTNQTGWYRAFVLKPFTVLAPMFRRTPLTINDDVFRLDGENTDYLASVKGKQLQYTAKDSLRSKLFQFHDNYRPPYYGTWRKRSKFITGRRPMAKEETLDYEVDSDYEWEAEPSDAEECRSDDEEDIEDEEMDDEENEGFLVEHGYLSEGEGESDPEEGEGEVECGDSDDAEDEGEEADKEAGSDDEIVIRPKKPRMNRIRLESAGEDKDKDVVVLEEEGQRADEKNPAQARAARDAEEERRVRLASRAREYLQGIARKKQKLVPFIWYQPLSRGEGDSASSFSLCTTSCPEEISSCTVVTIDYPLEEDPIDPSTTPIQSNPNSP